MTDRLHSLTVVLEQNLRDDDAQGLIAAIRHLRGVLDVTGIVATPESYMAERRARASIAEQLHQVLFPEGERDR